MPQDPTLEIRLAAVGVDQRPVIIAGHRVDSQVSSRQILLERHRLRRVHLEPGVPGRDLSFAARERILFVGLGVQEYREIAPDLAISKLLHLLR